MSRSKPVITDNHIVMDTEFYEKDGNVQLLTLAMIKADSCEAIYLGVPRLYDVIVEINDPWINENVLPDISPVNYVDRGIIIPSSMSEMRDMIIEFTNNTDTSYKNRFFARYPAYDQVAFRSGLFGKLINSPKNYEFGIVDVDQLFDMTGIPRRVHTVDENAPKIPKHNALCDAYSVLSDLYYIVRYMGREPNKYNLMLKYIATLRSTI